MEAKIPEVHDGRVSVGGATILCDKYKQYRQVQLTTDHSEVEVVFTFDTPEQAVEVAELLALATGVSVVCGRQHDD